MALEDTYKKILIDIIDKRIAGCKIWLFGSRARKTHKLGADIDIALDAGRILTAQEIFDIQEAIEISPLPVFVDIVDIHNVSEDFLNQIAKDWVIWKQ